VARANWTEMLTGMTILFVRLSQITPNIEPKTLESPHVTLKGGM